MDNEQQGNNLNDQIMWQERLNEERQFELQKERESAQNNISEANNQANKQFVAQSVRSHIAVKTTPKEIKKKSKAAVALGRLFLSYFLDLSAWAALFREKPVWAVFLAAGLIILVIVILMLLIVVFVRGICELSAVPIFWTADRCTAYILK